AGQKNGLGAIASLVFVASLALPLAGPGRRPTALAWWVRLSVIGMSALCMVNSGSRGAIMIAGVGLALVAAARMPRAVQRIVLVALVVSAIPIVNLAFSTLEFHADKIEILG